MNTYPLNDENKSSKEDLSVISRNSLYNTHPDYSQDRHLKDKVDNTVKGVILSGGPDSVVINKLFFRDNYRINIVPFSIWFV